MNYKLPLDATVLRDYLERRLPPLEEQALEQAIIGDPELAEHVRLEMALRDGMAELARRERPRASAVAPRSAAHSPRGAAVAHGGTRGPRRWIGIAAAAALVAIALVPATLLLRDRGGTTVVAETPLTSHVSEGGQLVSYQLPAQMVSATATSTETPAPLRLKLPQNVPEIVLELPEGSPSTPHRLLLTRADRPEVSMALAASTLPDSDQPGFVVGSQQLPAGQYQAQIERLENGAWVADKQFILRVEAPH